MRKLIAGAVVCVICTLVAPAHSQQIDAAFGGGSLASPGSSFSGGTFLPTEGGGAFVGFNGDVLFKGNLGVQAEVNWKGSQGMYGGQTFASSSCRKAVTASSMLPVCVSEVSARCRVPLL